MLLSEAYRAEQARLHSMGNYGTASLQYGQMVSQMVEKSGAKTLLDYGCGSMRNLAKVLDCDVVYEGYDPAVPAFAADPDAADLVVCIDVLEHIEPDCLDAVLDHIKAKSLAHVFLTIHTGPAVKTLSDGRNAHLIQQPPSWWLPKLMQRWSLLQFQANKQGFWVVMNGN
jgi:2-polyprenyl-3-methyl-5-hydroxy-6-metoxy-1,4-benzoquinol methylase